ncbi:type II secretion system protein J [Elusimicrobiota bacterium]
MISIGNKRSRTRGFTLIEMLVAMFLAINILAGMVMAYASVVRYLQQVRQKLKGDANAAIAMTFIEKEISNINIKHPNPDMLVYSPRHDADSAWADYSNAALLVGAEETDFGDADDDADRCFKICHDSVDKIFYYPSLTPADVSGVDMCNATSVSGTPLVCSAESGGLMIADKISDLVFTRTAPNMITIEIEAEMERNPLTNEITKTRSFKRSITLATSN